MNNITSREKAKQRERKQLKTIEIQKEYLNGMTEKQIRDLCENDPKLLVLWALHKYTPFRKLSQKQLGRRCGLGRCAVKNNIRALMERGLFRGFIKKIECVRNSASGDSVFYYFNSAVLSQLSFEELKNYNVISPYKNPRAPNKSEKIVEDILLELYPNGNPTFNFTGARCAANKICDWYPDFTCEEYPILIEHHGPHHSDPKRIAKDIVKYNTLIAKGYWIHIIENIEQKNREEEKMKIAEFVKNAIQNF